MKTKDEYIAQYTAEILDLLPKADPKYKEKGDYIRAVLILLWKNGEINGLDKAKKIIGA